MMRRLVALAAMAALPSAAQMLAATPSPAFVTDNVSVEINLGRALCPVLQPDGIRFDPPVAAAQQAPGMPAMISIRLQEESECASPPVSRLRVTLGRFPAGEYTVQVWKRLPQVGDAILEGVVAVGSFTIEAYAPESMPRDNYGGHWTTNLVGEGLSASQFGKRMFFSWLSYGADGKPTWLVVPDATFRTDGGHRRFEGTLFSGQGTAKPVIGMPFTPFTGVMRLGTASFVEVGIDEAALELRFDDGTQVDRVLKRFIF